MKNKSIHTHTHLFNKHWTLHIPNMVSLILSISCGTYQYPNLEMQKPKPWEYSNFPRKFRPLLLPSSLLFSKAELPEASPGSLRDPHGDSFQLPLPTTLTFIALNHEAAKSSGKGLQCMRHTHSKLCDLQQITVLFGLFPLNKMSILNQCLPKLMLNGMYR